MKKKWLQDLFYRRVNTVILFLFFLSQVGDATQCPQYSLMGKLLLKNQRLVLVTDPQTNNEKTWQVTSSDVFQLLPMQGQWIQGQFFVKSMPDQNVNEIQIDNKVSVIPFFNHDQTANHVQSLGLINCKTNQGME